MNSVMSDVLVGSIAALNEGWYGLSAAAGACKERVGTIFQDGDA
jgi:hypothetical protein